MGPRSPLDKENTRDGHRYQTKAKYAETRGSSKDRHSVSQIDPPTEIWRQVGTYFEPDQGKESSFQIHGSTIKSNDGYH